MADDREPLGRIVRETWVAWALEQPDLKPSWLIPWEELDEGQREVDMRIGAEVAAAERGRLRTHEHEWTRCPECKQPGQPCPCSGVPCCEMERREIAAANEAARDVQARAEAEVAAHREYDTYRRALWVMVRQFGGSVFLTSGQMEDVPLLASLGVGRAPGGIRINAEEEP